MLTFKSPWGNEYQIAFTIDQYANGNKGTALQLWCYETEEDYWEPYATATVNIDKTYYGSNKDVVFIDDNNCPMLSDWLEKNELASFTGRYGFSGYCAYAQMKLNRAEIEKHLLKGA